MSAVYPKVETKIPDPVDKPGRSPDYTQDPDFRRRLIREGIDELGRENYPTYREEEDDV